MTLQRRVRNSPEPVWLQSKMYPQYFTKTYHYQTDGWLSRRYGRVLCCTWDTHAGGAWGAVPRCRSQHVTRTCICPISRGSQLP